MTKNAEDVFEPPVPIVPMGWDLVPFADAVEVVSDGGKRVKQRAYLPTGKLPVIDQGRDFIGGYTDDDEMAFNGDLPVILFGDHTRSIKYVDQPFAIGAEGVKVLKPSAGFDPRYFFYFLRSLSIPSRGYSRHFQFLRKFHFPRAPECEQKRIVAEIEKQFSRLDEAVANLNGVKANLKHYRAAVLKAAVEGRLVETEAELARREGRTYEDGGELLLRILDTRRRRWKDKRKYTDPVIPTIEFLPSLPEGWVWATLEAITDAKAAVMYGILQPGPEVPGGVPYVRPTEINNDRIDLGSIRRTTAEIANRYQRSTLMSGDLILSIVGTIGKVAVVPDSLEGGNITQSSVRIRPASEDVHREFLASALRARTLTNQYNRKRLGTAVPRLNVEDVRQLFVPLPPPPEQRRIAAEIERRLSLIRQIETQIESDSQRSDRLRQSILDRAFTGRLNVDDVVPSRFAT